MIIQHDIGHAIMMRRGYMQRLVLVRATTMLRWRLLLAH